MRVVDPVPKDIGEAIVRELVSLVPILGDVFAFIEFFEAIREGRYDVALAYLVGAAGPGPSLPATHIIAYFLGKERVFKA